MIQVEGLWKRFRRFEALRDLSFKVPKGSALALIGANGAGKTTTIKITNQTGLRWVPEMSGYFVAFLGALTVLAIQYFRRRVSVARVLAIVAGILILLVDKAAQRFAFPSPCASFHSAIARCSPTRMSEFPVFYCP